MFYVMHGYLCQTLKLVWLEREHYEGETFLGTPGQRYRCISVFLKLICVCRSPGDIVIHKFDLVSSNLRTEICHF